MLVGFVLGLAVLAPLLLPGYVLSYDMVFVPRYRLSPELLGISEHVPRAVPVEAIVALASRLVPADILQKSVLLGTFVLAATGAARLTPAENRGARVAAGVLYAWNPFVYERLVIGHWALLVAYALLPWVCRAALIARKGGARAGVGLWIAGASAANPYGGILATGMAAAFIAAPPWPEGRLRAASNAAVVLLMGAGASLPWLVPALLGPDDLAASPRAVELFAARADSPLGVAGSLLSLGGIWNTPLAPPERASWAWVPAFAAVALVVALGWRDLARRWPAAAMAALWATAALGLVVAAGPALPIIGRLYRWAASTLPGGGVLRDSQKFVAPLAVAGAVGFGVGADRLLRTVAGQARRLGVVTFTVLPLSVIPTLAWGAGGRLGTAGYPESWKAAERIMADDPRDGLVLVLPWHLYLPFRWNGERITLDPAQRYFSRPAVTSTRLELRRGTLPSEEPLSARADPLVRSGVDLAPHLPGLGVQYVLLHRAADWRSYVPRLEGLVEVLDAPELRLYRSPWPARRPAIRSPPTLPVLVADAAALLLWVALAVAAMRSRATDAIVRMGP